MKVVHISCVAPPVTGGIGRVATEEVIRLQAKGIEAFVLAADGGGNPDIVRRLPTRIKLGNAAIPYAGELGDMLEDADIVHLHYPFYGTAEVIADMRRKNKIKRLVITLHMDAKAHGLKGQMFDLHRRFYQEDILNAADLFLCASHDYLKSASYAKLADDSRLREIPFGVDERMFCPGRPERKRFNLPEDVYMVGFVGGMDTPHAFKGVPQLIKAVAALPKNVHLQLTGHGDLKYSFERLAQEMGITDRCHFLGKASDGELPYLYRSMDVFAFPSTSSAEAFGLVAVEAQACGIPVIASDLPGVRTVIEDQVTGLLTPPGNIDELTARVRLLMENPEKGKRFGAAARQRVLEKYTWDKHMEGLIQAYQSLV